MCWGIVEAGKCLSMCKIYEIALPTAFFFLFLHSNMLYDKDLVGQLYQNTMVRGQERRAGEWSALANLRRGVPAWVPANLWLATASPRILSIDILTDMWMWVGGLSLQDPWLLLSPVFFLLPHSTKSNELTFDFCVCSYSSLSLSVERAQRNRRQGLGFMTVQGTFAVCIIAFPSRTFLV